jgi:hypothetical protein
LLKGARLLENLRKLIATDGFFLGIDFSGGNVTHGIDSSQESILLVQKFHLERERGHMY